MSLSSSPSRSDTKAPQSILDRIAAALSVVLGIVRKMPIVFLFAALAIVLYYRNAEQPEFEIDKQFPGAGEVQSEPKPPADLPEGANASVWSCVHQVDSKLSNGLWADVYYGMEVRLDGKMLTAKVTEKWQDLTDDKRKTVARLIVDTWIEQAQSLKFLTSAEDMEEVVIKRLPEDTTVATWKPSTGVLLSAPQTGA
jgi:flagellar biosynthesis component FlhA